MQITLGHVTLILAIIGCTVSYLSYRKKQYVPSEIVELKGELAQVQSDVAVIQKQVGLFWSLLEKNMSQLLHSPHRPKLDRLLEKNISGEGLSRQEAVQLVGLLQKLIDGGELARDEASWATLLMAVTVAKYKLTSGN